LCGAILWRAAHPLDQKIKERSLTRRSKTSVDLTCSPKTRPVVKRVERQEGQMRSNRYSEEQIIGILKEVQAGKSAREVIRHYGIAEATFYRWRERYAGVELAEARRMAQLEQENRRLKQMVAELSLDKEVLKSVIAKNGLRR